MLKLLPTLLCLGVILLACDQKRKASSELDKVIDIQGNLEAKSPDSTLIYLKQAQSFLDHMKRPPDSLQAENNYLLGHYFKEIGRMDSAAFYFRRATEYVKDSITSNNQVRYFQYAFNALNNLELYGECYSVNKAFQAILDPNKFEYAMSWSLYWDKEIHLKLRNYEKALESNDLQIKWAQKRDTANLPSALIDRSRLKKYYLNANEEAHAILDSLILNSHKLSYNYQTQLFGNKGVYLYREGKLEQALTNYIKAAKAAKKDTVRRNYGEALGIAYNNIAEVCIDLGNFGEARKYLDSVRQIGLSEVPKNVQESLMRYEMRLAVETDGDMKELFSIMDTINRIRDDVYKSKFEEELLALTKKTEEQKILTQQNQESRLKNFKLTTYMILLSISTVLLGVIGFLFYQRRRLKFEKHNLQAQQRLLRSQMNPHFTFNTLYAIQTEMKKDQKGASDYLLKFSRLLRLILENSTQNYVQLEKELDALKKYIDLQSIRQATKFDYHIRLENLEEDDMVFIPPMLLQPFVENSIEHGFRNLSYHGKLDIVLALKGKFIHCSIEDNGNGITNHESDYKNSTSVGLISDFIQKATKSKLQIIDKATLDKDQSGVLIKFLIPYRLTEND